MTYYKKAIAAWDFEDVKYGNNPYEVLIKLAELFKDIFKPTTFSFHYQPSTRLSPGFPIKNVREIINFKGENVNKFPHLHGLTKLKKENENIVWDKINVELTSVDRQNHRGLSIIINSDEWFKSDTDSKSLEEFNNCLRKAIEVFKPERVIWDCDVSDKRIKKYFADKTNKEGFDIEKIKRMERRMDYSE